MSEQKPGGDSTHLDDAAQLAALGYTSEFKREMGLWDNVAVGFTYLSPIVGVYTLFSASLAMAGPPMIWAFLIVAVGQFLVALVFGEIVSQYPVVGGVYPWSRRLWGRRWAWMTGWIYMFALFSSIGGIAAGASPFISSLFGHAYSVNYMVVSALGLLAVSTIINVGGTKVLSVAVMAGFITGLVGAIGVGSWLLIKGSHDFSVVFKSLGAADGKVYFYAFAAAGLVAVFQYYGFEACGDLAEEIPNPGVQVPKAMRMTIYIGGFAATFTAFTMIMAVVPNISKVIATSGECIETLPDGATCVEGALDPVSYTIHQSFGAADKFVLLIVVIAFLSCLISLQAAASRLVYSYSRDQMIMGHRVLRLFWQARHIPPFALVVAAAVPALVIVVVSRLSEDAVWKAVGFAAIGIYLGFQSVVLAALRARLKGWQPSGKFRLGKWGLAVNIGALTWGVCGVLAIVWPWDLGTGKPWYDVWIVLLSAVLVIGLGLVYMFTARPYQHSDTPAGDAIPQREGATKNLESTADATEDSSQE
ncbi:MAG: APC family permease [Micrococcales bacterium]|nr:APC family permease [Micrococcales bacterium]